MTSEENSTGIQLNLFSLILPSLLQYIQNEIKSLGEGGGQTDRRDFLTETPFPHIT